MQIGSVAQVEQVIDDQVARQRHVHRMRCGEGVVRLVEPREIDDLGRIRRGELSDPQPHQAVLLHGRVSRKLRHLGQGPMRVVDAGALR